LSRCTMSGTGFETAPGQRRQRPGGIPDPAGHGAKHRGRRCGRGTGVPRLYVPPDCRRQRHNNHQPRHLPGLRLPDRADSLSRRQQASASTASWAVPS
jgi:hypothetical protein